jgi:hypothetical protein
VPAVAGANEDACMANHYKEHSFKNVINTQGIAELKGLRLDKGKNSNSGE